MAAQKGSLEEMLQDMDYVTMDTEDGEITMGVVAIYPCNDKQYVALMPLDENGEQIGDDLYVYRFIGHGDDVDPELEYIDDPDELDDAEDALDELLDNWQFEHME